MKNNPDKTIMTVAEFLSDAQTSDLVTEDPAEQKEDAKLKDARARRDEEWSFLANQVVGGETAMFPVQKLVCQEGEKEMPKTPGEVGRSSHCCGESGATDFSSSV